MPPVVLAAREANVAHDADKATAGNEHAECFTPHAIQFGEELVLFLDVEVATR